MHWVFWAKVLVSMWMANRVLHAVRVTHNGTFTSGVLDVVLTGFVGGLGWLALWQGYEP